MYNPPPPPNQHGSNLPPQYQPDNSKGSAVDWKFYGTLALIWVLGNFVISTTYFIANLIGFPIWEYQSIHLLLTIIELGILALPIFLVARQPQSTIKMVVIVFASVNVLIAVIRSINFWFNIY